MFRAVRHWWTGGRGKVTARLFAFEFVVVVAGVLVAQGLANWIGRRADLLEMEQALARSDHETAQSLEVALVWKAAIPCLRDRLETLQRAAAIGPVPSDLTARPALRSPPLGLMPDDAALLYRQRYGAEVADRKGDMAAANEQMVDEVRTLSRVWARLALADERFGAVGGGDRLAAREAAADALASLRTIGILAESVVTGAEEAGLSPIEGFPGRGPARSCRAIWVSGEIDPPRSMP